MKNKKETMKDVKKAINLFAKYAKDIEKQCVTGAKFVIDEENDCYIMVKRWHFLNKSFSARMALLSSQKLSEEEFEQKANEIFIEELICGWNNVADKNDEIVEFSTEKAKEILLELPDLLLTLNNFSLNADNYSIDDIVKN